MGKRIRLGIFEVHFGEDFPANDRTSRISRDASKCCKLSGGETQHVPSQDFDNLPKAGTQLIVWRPPGRLISKNAVPN